MSFMHYDDDPPGDEYDDECDCPAPTPAAPRDTLGRALLVAFIASVGAALGDALVPALVRYGKKLAKQLSEPPLAKPPQTRKPRRKS